LDKGYYLALPALRGPSLALTDKGQNPALRLTSLLPAWVSFNLIALAKASAGLYPRYGQFLAKIHPCQILESTELVLL